MGITLLDDDDDKPSFSINFWNWRAIVEAVRRLEVLPDEKVDGLHDPFCGNGLTAAEARLVADAIDTRLIPTLAEGERLLLRGDRTTVPDDGTFHKGNEIEKNYSTNRDVLKRFAKYCRGSSGFRVC